MGRGISEKDKRQWSVKGVVRRGRGLEPLPCSRRYGGVKDRGPTTIKGGTNEGVFRFTMVSVRFLLPPDVCLPGGLGWVSSPEVVRSGWGSCVYVCGVWT